MQDDRLDCDHHLLSRRCLLHPGGQLWGHYVRRDIWTEIALWTVTGVLLVVTVLLTIFHPGVTKENRLYPAHLLRRPILVNLQLQVFLVSGIMLVGHHTYNVPVNMLTDPVDNDLSYTTILSISTGT